MKFFGNLLISLAVFSYLGACAEVVETEKFSNGSELSEQSGDAQGALVSLTGTVTELEDLESGKKLLGLSVNDEEVVALEVNNPKLYIKGELVQIEAKLVKRLANKLRVFKALTMKTICKESEESKACFKPMFGKLPVKMTGVLHKINSSEKEILTIVSEDRVVQISDEEGLLSDKEEGEEVAVAGYFKTKFAKDFIHKVLVVKKVLDELPEKVSKTVKGKLAYGFRDKLVFLTDEGFPIVVAKGKEELFLGEEAEATIAYKTVPVSTPSRLGDLFSGIFGMLKQTEKVDVGFGLKGLPALNKKVAYIESIKYLSCDEECNSKKLAMIGYFYAEEDILFVNKDKKLKLEFSSAEDKSEISGTVKSLVLVSGLVEDSVLKVETAESIVSDKFPLDFLDTPGFAKK